MARIDVLPSIEIIRGLKGILDFYLWRGLPCVRAWPTWRPTRQTDASKAAALTFGAIVKAYALLANLVLAAYRQDALDQPRTARDIMVTGAFGNLHEASMSDFLDALIIIRDAVVALTDLLHALDSIDTDELVVNVDQSVLPAGASTLAEQQTQTTALAKIDDLQDTLESVALDRLLVRGMDQLHSFAGVLATERVAIISGAAGFLDSNPVPAGQIWHITHIYAIDVTSATTAHTHDLHHNGVVLFFNRITAAMPANRPSSLFCNIWLDPSDTLRVYFSGANAGDTCAVALAGQIMTLET